MPVRPSLADDVHIGIHGGPLLKPRQRRVSRIVFENHDLATAEHFGKPFDPRRRSGKAMHHVPAQRADDDRNSPHSVSPALDASGVRTGSRFRASVIVLREESRHPVRSEDSWICPKVAGDLVRCLQMLTYVSPIANDVAGETGRTARGVSSKLPGQMALAVPMC